MRESMVLNLGGVMASVLVLLSAGHVYWAAGGRLGGRLQESTMLPERDGQPVFRPSPAAALGVALALLGAAAVLALRAGVLGNRIGDPAVRWASWGVAAVFLLRSVGDFRWVGFFRRERGTRFAYWDARVYTPVAVALGLSAAVIAWGAT